ncbi:bifunctional DNA primase/polymerase [Corynebacterium comes]|uniref:DNA primase/polymerase bifunctional N-terminal domain-containing protein n=1 Tax=Corynebacterium comes TaxID=2675218 RepID=A0A6B8VIF7_9CORY|nr:bifunctional DNA primase/polymerase [Corynebacterium comes]QGU05122.1 hypothetical protein CETAM_09355 [Corynebacterium comes]
MTSNNHEGEEVTMNDYTISEQGVKPFEQYIFKGWVTPFPLPCGSKFPPRTGFTGDIETVSEEVTREAWDREMGDFNLGLRMDITGDYDVISLDVDEYRDKKGMQNLVELMDELGELPLKAIPRSTRRGVDSPAAQYFFLVPRGLKWASKVCADVEVIQKNHRYSAVWPSEVEGEMYRWYIGDEEIEIPNVKDLPVLPQAWINYLQRGNLIKRHAPSEYFGNTEADEWLSKVAPGWADAPSAGFLTGLEPKLEAMVGNAHDTLNDSLWWAVRYAVLDGQPGLKAAIEALKAKFFAEAERDYKETAETEYARNYLGAVNKTRGDIEHKKATPFLVKYSPALLTGFTLLTGAQKAAKAHEDLTEKINRSMRMPAPLAVPRLIALLCPELVTVRNSGSEDSILNMAVGETLQYGDLREILEKTVMPEIHRYRIQFEDDSDEDKAGKAVLSKALALCEANRPVALFENTANAVRDMGRKFTASKIDANPYLLGVGDEVLDLQAVIDNPDGGLESWLRPREYEDAVTKSLTLDIRAGLKSLEYREQSPIAKETHTERLLKVIQPDEDTRQFLQKALGYSMFGKNKAHKFFVWFGPGGSGKGSIVDSVMSVLGEDVYASQITPEQFKKGSASKPDPEYTKSLTTRMTFVNETDEGTKIDASAIKRATESRSGRALHSNNVVKQDGNTITFMTNRVFSFEHDSGVERRLAVIPFTQAKKAVKEAQPHINSEWREHEEEKVWFLNWLLEGFALSMSEGLEQEDYPPLVAQATARFIAEADPSMVFFQMLERTGDPDDYVRTEDMARSYRDVTGDLTIAEKALSMKINRWFRDQGHADDKDRVNDKRVYRGWTLNEE